MHSLPSARRMLIPLFVVAALSLTTQTTFAQLPAIKLYAVSPAGGQQGTTFDLNITSGDDLDELDKLLFNHAGITAQRKTTEKNGQQIPVGNTFIVTVDKSVPAGTYEVRCGGLYGVSNPRRFIVGSLPEITETESNNTLETANAVNLNSTVNGVVSGRNDIDYFKVTLKAGQRMLCELAAWSIDSRLDGALKVYDANGRRIAFSLYAHFSDAFIDVTAKSDGDYFVAVHDQEFEGAGDFHYRLKVHNGPYFDYIDPPAGLPGQSQAFTLYGRNLPGGSPSGVKINGLELQKLDINLAVPTNPQVDLIRPPHEVTSDRFIHTHTFGNGQTLDMPIHLAGAQVVQEAEPNDASEQPQTVSIPAEIVGRINKPNDLDTYRFSAKKGDDLWLTVFAQRDGSPIDVYLMLTQITKDKNGNEVRKAINVTDDFTSNMFTNVFDTFNDDPVYNLKVGADADYEVKVLDRFATLEATPKHHYRLRIRPATPGFTAVALPQLPVAGKHTTSTQTSVNLRKGDTIGVQLMIEREEGFTGDIEFSVDGLPGGVTASKLIVGNKQSTAMLVLNAAENATPGFSRISITGKSNINGKEISKPVSLATVVYPASGNTTAMSRTSTTLGLCIQDEVAPIQATSEGEFFDVKQSSQILIPVKLAKRNGFDADVNFTIADLAKNSNIDAKNFKIAKGQGETLLRIFVNDKAPEGTYAFHFKPQTQFDYSRNPALVDRLKAEQTKIAEQQKAAEEESKKATDTANDLANKIKAIENELKKLDNEKKQFDQKLKQAQSELDKANKELDQAKKELEAKTKATEDLKKAVDAAKKAAESAKEEDKQKLADALKESEAKLAMTTQEQTQADAVFKQKQTAVENAAKNVASQQTEVKKRDDAIAKNNAERTKLNTDKAKADEATKTATAKLNSIKAEKTAIDKEVSNATNAAKPKKLTLASPSVPVSIRVSKAAVKLSPNVPGGGNLKKGEKLEIKVGVNRLNDFKGPVELSLPLPPGVTGLKANPVTVAPDAKEAVLVVEATGEATEGQLANMVIRGTADFNGKGSSDAPITLKINK